MVTVVASMNAMNAAQMHAHKYVMTAANLMSHVAVMMSFANLTLVHALKALIRHVGWQAEQRTLTNLKLMNYMAN